MQKVIEDNNKGLILKGYRECEFNSAMEFMKFIASKYGQNFDVKISEDTDRDYKSYDGLTFHFEELLTEYENIVKKGQDVSFDFEINFNSAPVMLSVSSDGNYIAIISNSNIELSDIIGLEKKNSISLG